MRKSVAVITAILIAAGGGWADVLLESARDIPVAYDVDVVVVGGASGGVAAAVAAAEQGARVFLAAPRPYLGEDLCATCRLWLEPGEEPGSELAKRMFQPPLPPFIAFAGVPFTYESDCPSADAHRDTSPPRMLADQKADAAAKDSVQYDGDVTITLDLGREMPVSRLHVIAFHRARDFETPSVTVSFSNDRQSWTPVGRADSTVGSASLAKDAPVHIPVDVSGKARYVQLAFRKTPDSHRILLGEIIVESETAKTVLPGRDVRIPPMPMQVKRTLDEALINAGVSFLYGCYATDLLRDALGKPAGIVMANRSGRQAVRARVVVDATPRAMVARLAGAEFRDYPSGPQAFRRVVFGGAPPENGDVRVAKLPAPIQIEQGGLGATAFQDAYECMLTLPAQDGSFAAFARAEQSARDRTWTPRQMEASETLFQVPPDAVRARKSAPGPWRGAAQADLDIFRPANVEGLYVLGGCADVSREAAERMLRPLAFLELGERIGREAATEAKAMTDTDSAMVAKTSDGAVPRGEVRELLAGLRPSGSAMAVVHEDARGLPILAEYDVIVVGGGTGGAPAGLAAARKGAKTLVIEYLDGLGGVGTLGLIGNYYHGYRGGFTKEVDQGVGAMGGDAKPACPSWNVEWKMEWFRRELRRAGVDVWFGVLACGAVVEDARVAGVVVATPDGRGVVLAKAVIDATGNADIAAAAGAACMTPGEDNLAVQGTGMPPHTPGDHYANTDYTITDDADVVDAWRTFVSGRNKYRDAFDLATIVDSRERRRVVGDFVISPLDVYNQRTYPDTIGKSSSNFDTHGFTIHAMFALRNPDKEEVSAYTPYRALLPKGLDGLLVTGLGISAHRDAMPILRMQPDIQNQGYAAGAAAAMSVKAGCPLRKIDVKALQQHLVDIGNIPNSVPTDQDSYPFSADKLLAAVRQVVPDYENVAVLLTQPDESLPLLRDAFANAREDKARGVYAHILGMLGDAAGADTLAKAVAETPWDDGWSFTGGGQFGGSLSPLDSLIVALGRTRQACALEPILAKAAALDANAAFSHHRAVAVALETLGKPEAASILAALLAKPGMTGYACTEIQNAKKASEFANPNMDRDRSIREVLLARALFRCGDQNGLARSLLEGYTHDLRAYFARHARNILGGNAATATDPLDLEPKRAAGSFSNPGP